MPLPFVQIKTGNTPETSKKRKDFTEGEISELVSEVEARQNILFSGLSSGVSS